MSTCGLLNTPVTQTRTHTLLRKAKGTKMVQKFRKVKNVFIRRRIIEQCKMLDLYPVKRRTYNKYVS